jgi:hypothetical protein
MTRDYAAAVRAGDVIDFCDLIWTNALSRTGLGGPDGPEPDKPSPRYRAPSLSQVSSQEKEGGR